jgi:hypothetical protein
MINRNTTNGKYGIWGHIIKDLILNSIEEDERSSIESTAIFEDEEANDNTLPIISLSISS